MHTKINSELILASKNAATGDILYTFKWTYPRAILAEVNTHRVFSRNTASSRAIPSKKYRARVANDPFVPIYWGLNQKGMQASVEATGLRLWLGKAIWRAARWPNLLANWSLDKLGFHKQIGNRLVEPWVWTEQVVSFTEVENFLALRAHWMAEPHMQELAYQVKRQVKHVQECFRLWDYKEYDDRLDAYFYPYRYSNMQVLEEGEWHLPFIDWRDRAEAKKGGVAANCDIDRLKIVSAARCARVSYYLPEDGSRSTFAKDKQLHDRLVVRDTFDDDDPIHASPVEHQARAMHDSTFIGNLRGWRQYRKDFPLESGSSK